MVTCICHTYRYMYVLYIHKRASQFLLLILSLRSLRALTVLNGPDQPYLGPWPTLKVQLETISSCLRCLEECWSPARPMAGHGVFFSRAQQVDWFPSLRPGSGLPPRPYLDVTGPDLWTGFLAWSWTCPINVLLPCGLDPWLHLAAISGPVLLAAVGQAMGSPQLLACNPLEKRHAVWCSPQVCDCADVTYCGHHYQNYRGWWLMSTLHMHSKWSHLFAWWRRTCL